jgi:hypothetical protein
MVEIDTDHLVLARESIDDPSSGAPQPAGQYYPIGYGTVTPLVAKSPGSVRRRLGSPAQTTVSD